MRFRVLWCLIYIGDELVRRSLRVDACDASGIPNTNITIQYGILAFIAAVFGPIAGLLSGLIGHFFIDFSYGWGNGV